MNLREQLRNLLPDLLPDDPAEAIKGTELIRLVRVKLGEGYSDATLRYHFSILSYDPSSPIATVDQGQGYYQRQHKLPALHGVVRQRFFDDPAPGDGAQNRSPHPLTVALSVRLLPPRAPHSCIVTNITRIGCPSSLPDLHP